MILQSCIFVIHYCVCISMQAGLVLPYYSSAPKQRSVNLRKELLLQATSVTPSKENRKVDLFASLSRNH